MIVIKAVRGYIIGLRKISEHKRLGTRWRLGLLLLLPLACLSGALVVSYNFSTPSDQEIVTKYFGDKVSVYYEKQNPPVNLYCAQWPLLITPYCNEASTQANRILLYKKERATSIYCAKDTCPKMKSLPPEIKYLTRLELLGLEDVGLQTLPP